MATYQDIVDIKRPIYNLTDKFEGIQELDNVYNEIAEYSIRVNLLNTLDANATRKYWFTKGEQNYERLPVQFGGKFVSYNNEFTKFSPYQIQSDARVWSALYELSTNTVLEQPERVEIVIEDGYLYYMCAAIFVNDFSNPFLYNKNINFSATDQSGKIYTVNNSTFVQNIPRSATKLSVNLGSRPTLNNVRQYNDLTNYDAIYYNPLIFRTKNMLTKNDLPRIYTKFPEKISFVSADGYFIEQYDSDKAYESLIISL